jgi:hypothetical protein
VSDEDRIARNCRIATICAAGTIVLAVVRLLMYAAGVK